jgi:stage II sporulation protein D
MPLGNDDLLFYGRGFGHGVGLSQEGAMCMAKQGLNYKTILHHYFQNVKIMPLQHYHITKP